MNELQDLLDRGLHHYGLGEVKRAAQLWLELLQKDPEHREARRYLDYLREHKPEVFAGLEAPPTAVAKPAGVDWASGVPAPPAAARVPVKLGSSAVGSRVVDPPVGDPFDLLTSPAVAQPHNPLVDGAVELFGLNDFEGALDLVDKADGQGVLDRRLKRLREQCEGELLKLYETRLGDLQRTPRTKVGSGDLVWLNLDHRAGFLLSLIDGRVSFDEVFSLSGMSRLETARVLSQLVREAVIG